jgi:hypothetical protein
MPGYTMQSRGTARTPPPRRDGFTQAPEKDVDLQIATEPVWAQNPESQQTKVNSSLLSPGLPRN